MWPGCGNVNDLVVHYVATTGRLTARRLRFMLYIGVENTPIVLACVRVRKSR
jgi:hypothetical protein